MIRLLDETTVGAIAAGEVVERPVSVVKELVENALDAGATRISVAIARGGLDSIDVTDNGSGIAPDELPLAFARHATSKLAGAADLERIATLGFRGEGLASIAAVARVRLLSRRHEDEVGYYVHAHGHDCSQPEPHAASPGTLVTATKLFANVPVRREYLRSPAAEFSRISTFLATLALGYPHVAFTLTHDGRTTFAFPAAEVLAQRLTHVFGAAADALIVLEDGQSVPGVTAFGAHGTRNVRVRGFISTPGSERGDRRMQFLFVNGRLLRSTLVTGAWLAGYATYVTSGRHPFGVIFLDVPAQQVDPNIHPTKSDVRLRYPDAVHNAVRRSISQTLARNASARLRATLSFAPPATMPKAAAIEERMGDADGQPALRAAFAEGGDVGTAWRQSPTPVTAGALRILAQLDDTFILATDGSALVLVDQHAAHERVAFETIAMRARAGETVCEPLLVPLHIELDAEDFQRFEAARGSLVAAGLEAEPFGERTYRIVATPAGYGARPFDWRGYVADLRDDGAGLDAPERVWASLACHSVVRAGEPLEPAEMSALLARLARCTNAMHCPHGRPTLVRIEAGAISRMFKRT